MNNSMGYGRAVRIDQTQIVAPMACAALDGISHHVHRFFHHLSRFLYVLLCPL